MKKIIIVVLIIIALALLFKGKKIAGVEGGENINKTESIERQNKNNNDNKRSEKGINQGGAFKINISGIENNKSIDPKFAYCVGKDGDGENLRPEISWENAPEGTKSFAVIVVDPDVPTDFTDAGKEGKTIPADQKRQDFVHYALIDIPANINKIEAGKGRGTNKAKENAGKTGINDYAVFMPNAKTEDHAGWDGMCPPWNDERTHHYNFIVYALKVETLGLKDGFKASEAYKLAKANSIAEARIIGTYTRNDQIKIR